MKTAMVGKLHIESTTPANGRFYLNDDSSVTVAEVIATETGLQLAHIIAAAPEMYEALEKAQRLVSLLLAEVRRPELQDYLGGDVRTSVEDAALHDSLGIDAAIAKAEGRQ